LGCWGAPPPDYPDDIRRCLYCEGNTAGSVEIDVSQEVYDEVMFGDKTVESLNLPPAPDCPTTGARRFYTSSTLG